MPDDIKDDDSKYLVDETSGTIAIGSAELSEDEMKAYMEMKNVWAVFGHGFDVPPVGGVIRSDVDPLLSPADRVVSEAMRGQVKRHLLDPADIGIEVNPQLGGFDRLLLLEYPLDLSSEMTKPANTPFYFGKTRIDGGWAVIWHDTKTGTDKFIHCAACVQTTVGALMFNQKDQMDAAKLRKTLN